MFVAEEGKARQGKTANADARTHVAALHSDNVIDVINPDCECCSSRANERTQACMYTCVRSCVGCSDAIAEVHCVGDFCMAEVLLTPSWQVSVACMYGKPTANEQDIIVVPSLLRCSVGQRATGNCLPEIVERQPL